MAIVTCIPETVTVELETVPVILLLPLLSVKVDALRVVVFRSLLKVALIVAFVAIPVALIKGLRVAGSTAGGVVSGATGVENVQESGLAKGTPFASCSAVLTVAVYVVN